LDPVTCFAIATLMTLLNGAILGLVHADLPAELRPSAVDWRVSTLLMAGGSLLLTAQGSAPWLVLPLANALLMLALTGYWRALRRFYGVPDTPWLALPAALGTVGVVVFSSAYPSLTARVVLVSVVWLVSLLGSVQTLRSAGVKDRSVSRRVLMGIFLVLAAFMLLRAGYFAVYRPTTTTVLDRGSLMNFVTPMLAAVLPVMGTTAFLLLCSDNIRKRWERAASTDYLTGLANRLTLGREAERRWGREGGSRGLAVAVVDVDHFKSINDRHGHDVGDLALKHVASRLEAACRAGDLPARQGGEEFVVVFDAVTRAEATEVAERLRAAVSAAPFRAEGVERTITVSIGVAAKVEADASFEDLLRRADKALYAAKSAGRNRVEVGE